MRKVEAITHSCTVMTDGGDLLYIGRLANVEKCKYIATTYPRRPYAPEPKPDYLEFKIEI